MATKPSTGLYKTNNSTEAFNWVYAMGEGQLISAGQYIPAGTEINIVSVEYLAAGIKMEYCGKISSDCQVSVNGARISNKYVRMSNLTSAASQPAPIPPSQAGGMTGYTNKSASIFKYTPGQSANGGLSYVASLPKDTQVIIGTTKIYTINGKKMMLGQIQSTPNYSGPINAAGHWIQTADVEEKTTPGNSGEIVPVEGDLRYIAVRDITKYHYANVTDDEACGKVKKGEEVRIFYTKKTKSGALYGCVSSNPTPGEWILYKLSNGTLSTNLTDKGISVENNAVVNGEETVTSTIDASSILIQDDDEPVYEPAALIAAVNDAYNTLTSTDEEAINNIVRLKNVIGKPPIFTGSTDIRYMKSGRFSGGPSYETDFGRNWINMFGQSNTILSIQPGKVKYMPGFSGQDKETFWQMAQEQMNGNTGEDSALSSNMTGQLYEFRSDYTSYINKVNLLARTMSIYLGIGDKECPLATAGAGRTYKTMNYSFITNILAGTQFSFEGDGIFSGLASGLLNLATAPIRAVGTGITHLIGSSISDDTWLHFYMSADGTGSDDSMSVSTRPSSLESLFSGNLSGLARDIEFLTGSAMNTQGIEDVLTGAVNGLIPDGSSLNNVMNQLVKGGADVLSGGHLVFPQMIDDCNYEHSYRASLKLVAPHADPESIFLYEYLPICHLLPFVLPEMLSDNTYTYPCICKAHSKGMFASDLAIISQLSINRGGNDSSQWNLAGLPTECDVSFNITPLYSKLMTTTTAHPIMFMHNTALQEYLGAICGVTFTGERLLEKLSILRTLTADKILYDPTVNLATGFFDSTVANTIRKLFNMP